MSDEVLSEQEVLAEKAAEIVSAYISNSSLQSADLPGLSTDVVPNTLVQLTDHKVHLKIEDKRQPAVPIRKSVKPEYIDCLEYGKKFRSLKRHLRGVFP